MINRSAWDQYARERRSDDSAHMGFCWSQFPGVGPQEELFGGIAGKVFLEVGCGSGRQLALLVSKGANGIGIDVSPEQIERARSRWQRHSKGIQFIVGDASDISSYIAEASIDVAYSVFGAIGLSDPERTFRQIRTCLRPNGRLLFSIRHPRWDLATVGEDPFSSDYGSGPNPWGRRVVQFKISADESEPVVRYQYPVQVWERMVGSSGLVVDDVLELLAPLDEVLTFHPCLLPKSVRSLMAHTPTTLLMVSRVSSADLHSVSGRVNYDPD